MSDSIDALDSSYDKPTSQILSQAWNTGVRAWGGYLVSDDDSVILEARKMHVGLHGLLAPWTTVEFAAVQESGMRALAFCSGNDDPTALKVKAAALGLLALLDHESGIRADGPWVDPWLAASGFGLYAGMSLQNHAAPYRIAAQYPVSGCGDATWPGSPAPSEPHGWQCQGTHVEFGLSVDRSRLDGFFGPVAAPVLVLEECEMGSAVAIASFGGQAHEFDVDETGQIRHRWFTNDAGWRVEYLPGSSGLEAGQDVVASVLVVPGQLQVYAQNPSSRLIYHAWFIDAGWQYEVLPA